MPVSAAPNDSPQFQFTLRQLLTGMTILCVLTALGSWLGIGTALFLFVLFTTITIAIRFASKRRFAEAALTVLVGFIFLVLLLPTLGTARDSPRWAFCQNNMRNIALALQQYEILNGTLPPAYIADESGKPMHSWRVLLLPYLEQQQIYRQYRFDEPWDSPNNSQLHGHIVKLFKCPSDNRTTNDTSYVFVTGSQTIWPGATATKLADIKDGPGSTIFLVEVHNSGIHWMEPRDLDFAQMPMAINPTKGLGISSVHLPEGFANVVFADGKPQRIPNTASAKAIRAALTISGGEKDRLPVVKDRR